MDFDAWHHWLFLRPLIVFVLACPPLFLLLFVGSYRERRDAKRARKAEADRAPPAITVTTAQPTRLDDKCHSNGRVMTEDGHTDRSLSIELAPLLYAFFTPRRRPFYEVLMYGRLFLRVRQT
jgi:hypothetical protein